jgi:hypothetical protein
MILQLFIRPAPGIALGHFDLFFALIYQNIHIVLDEPRDFWGPRPGGLHRFDSLLQSIPRRVAPIRNPLSASSIGFRLAAAS